MRGMLVMVAAAGLAVSGTAAMGQITPVRPAPTPKAVNAVPVITFQGLERDFGSIGDDQMQEHRFRFTNTGTADLEITNTRGSCGCTVPALDRKLFRPGESGEITVSYNPHNRRGPQHQTITVTSNDPNNPQVQLTIKANVRPLISVDPAFVQLGEVERGKGATQTVMITSRDPDLKPQGLHAEGGPMTAVIGEGTPIEWEGSPAMQWPVTVSLSPEQGIGPVQSVLVFRTNRADRTLSVTVTGEVVGDVKALPQRVTLGAMTPGQGFTSEVRLAARNNTPFEIKDVSQVTQFPASAGEDTNPAGLKFETIKESDNPLTYVVRVTGTAPAVGGQMRGEVVIRTSLATDSEVRVPFFGFVRGPGTTPVRVQPTPVGQAAPNPSSLVPGRP